MDKRKTLVTCPQKRGRRPAATPALLAQPWIGQPAESADASYLANEGDGSGSHHLAIKDLDAGEATGQRGTPRWLTARLTGDSSRGASRLRPGTQEMLSADDVLPREERSRYV
ncbi:MAG TPA: hypothetical protein VGF67_26185 [Ktedonobacteraceae bacterium]